MAICECRKPIIDHLAACNEIDEVVHHFRRGAVNLQEGEETE